MTIKIPIFKSCLLAAGLAQLTCSLSAETATLLALCNNELFDPKVYGIQEKPVERKINNLEKQPCIEIKIPNSQNSLFFPGEGIQPTTEEAGLYSGARNIDDRAITNWYMKIFQEKFITTEEANGVWPAKFTLAFRNIASDPVGRVLLYRLIIECTRLDVTDMNNIFHCCEEGIVGIKAIDLQDRAQCCKITISTNPKENMSFSPDGTLYFNPLETSGLNVFTECDTNTFDTFKEKECPLHIGLFHEMLHWLHWLQHPTKFENSNKKEANIFKYPFRCYYGDATDLITWHSSIKIDAEEIATILGCPNYTNENLMLYVPARAFLPKQKKNSDIKTSNGFIPMDDKFLNGEDLSENAYRLSQSQNGKNKFHLRFGHNSEHIDKTDMVYMPNRLFLAHAVAIDCYERITNQKAENWDLEPEEAIQVVK